MTRARAARAAPSPFTSRAVSSARAKAASRSALFLAAHSSLSKPPLRSAASRFPIAP